ncbi:DUF4097 domain-containing protein [Salinibacterium sp. dk2585]|uniref:DUF4097 family beta strand repeat-containing protein n=1 Tax=unclassified Salinibacterium TaxID=2632331 RepID=UPI0011C255D9|nr:MULTISPECIES: DUF4097 family beta strand repeat-containing protein [unclassified Salinibacterium]QEE60465.1 DUF4097 domain-containing protein [Salinibacterium sp. dk2585]TXK55538.1 DUF4097 domain-containing protein [Salinibacterium sp. dk5596]
MAREKWMLEGPKTIDFDSIHTLKVGLIGGQVDIVAHDEPGARVEVHSVSGKPLKVSLDEGVLEIDHPQLAWDNFLQVFSFFKNEATAEVSIMVPRSIALKFGVVTASALISGLDFSRKTGRDAVARISTVSGEVVIDRVIGELDLNSVSGEIAVREHTGDISANTVSGELMASGNISRVSHDSVSGDVFLDLAGTPDRVKVNTVSGDVSMRLAPGVAASYKISTASGRVQLNDSSVSIVHGTYNGSFGELSGKWLEFSVNSVTGDVTVHHAVAAQ